MSASSKSLSWPELSPAELASLYCQIKENQAIDLNWTNPGRVEPELVFAKLKKQDTADASGGGGQLNESDQRMDEQEAEAEFEDATDMNNEFDMFDDFNSDDKCTKEKVAELRLKHSTTRDTKKVASMDKILFDIKKKFETEEYIRKHSTDDASSILSETTGKPPDSVESQLAGAETEPQASAAPVESPKQVAAASETVPAEPQASAALAESPRPPPSASAEAQVSVTPVEPLPEEPEVTQTAQEPAPGEEQQTNPAESQPH